MVDDSTLPAVLEAVRAELAALLEGLVRAPDLGLGEAEREVREGVLAVGARLLEAGLAARGTGKAGPRLRCPCGGAADFEGYRPKGVQTLVGWVEVRRAYYACPACGHGRCPLDDALGLARGGHSPGVRGLAGRFGRRRRSWPRRPPSACRRVRSGARPRRSGRGATRRSWPRSSGAGRRGGPRPRRRRRTGGTWRWTGCASSAPTARARRPRSGSSCRPSGAGTARSGGRPATPPASSRRRRSGGGWRWRRPGAAPRGRGRSRRWGTGRPRVPSGRWTLAAEHCPTAVCIVDWFHASEPGAPWAMGPRAGALR
jgi:hypothetical protein